MNKKIPIILIFVVIFLSIFGCPGTPVVCGDGICQIGEDQDSCPADCSTLSFCSELNGKTLDNYEYINLQESNFWKVIYFGKETCNGKIVDSRDGDCCIGQIDSIQGWLNMPTEVVSDNPVSTGINIYNEQPIIELTKPNGDKSTYDCSNQTDYTDCKLYFDLEPDHPLGENVISYKITHNGQEYFIDGNFISLNTNEYANLCDQRTESLTPTILTKENGERENLLLSGSVLNLKGINSKNYLIDTIKAKKYSKLKKEVSLEELDQISRSNRFIVELKEDPALEKYKDEIYSTNINISGISIDIGDIYKKINDYANQIKQKQDNLIKKLESKGVIINSQYKYTFNGIGIKTDGREETLEEIKNNPMVKEIYPDVLITASLDTSVDYIGATSVWNDLGYTGKGIKIGIIDTGVDYTHPDLGGCIGINCKVKGGFDAVEYDDDPMDDHGHGTHVASIAAGNGVLKGVAPDADIYAIKVLDSQGSGYSSGILRGIEWTIDPNEDGDFSDRMDIINLSLGGWGNPDDPMSQAIDNAYNSGVLPIIAAGNSYNYGSIGSPGTSRKAITVGAIDNLNELSAEFSSRGPVIYNNEILIKPEITAPGVNICAAQFADAWSENECIDTEHTSISGTSMATPHVTGLAALVKEANPNADNNSLKSFIINTANKPLSQDTFTYGAGIISAVEAVTPKIKITPSTVNIGELNENNYKIEIENISTKNVGLDYNTLLKLDKFIPGNTPIIIDSEINGSLDKTCLAPGEKTILNLSISKNNYDYGIYAGNIELNITDNCSEVTLTNSRIPITFSKSKTINLNINHINTDNEFIVYAILTDENGNSLSYYENSMFNSENLENNGTLKIYSDLTKANLFYYANYLSPTIDTITQYAGVKEILIDSTTTINIDETNSTKINTNYSTIMQDKQIESADISWDFKKIGTSHSFSNGGPCSNWLKNINLYSINNFLEDINLSIKLITNPKGKGAQTSQEKELYNQETTINSNNKNLTFTQPTNQIQIKFNKPFKTDTVNFGLNQYNSKTKFMMTSINKITGKDINLNYSNGDDLGILTVYWNSINEKDPVIARSNWAEYEVLEQYLFNGKDKVDPWPTGNLPEKIEFMKMPLKMPQNLNYSNYYNNTIYPDVLKTSYLDTKIFPFYWNVYNFEMLEPYRLGKTKITTPSGKIIENNGFDFQVSCSETGNWLWPEINPCEIGTYTFEISTQGLVKENPENKTYSAEWTGEYWNIN